MTRKLKSVTPGELLREEFLKPMGISEYRLAKEIGVPAQRIATSSQASAALPRTPTCVYAGFSLFLTGTGCVLRQSMTPKSRNVLLRIKLEKIKPWKGVSVDGTHAQTRS